MTVDARVRWAAARAAARRGASAWARLAPEDRARATYLELRRMDLVAERARAGTPRAGDQDRLVTDQGSRLAWDRAATGGAVPITMADGGGGALLFRIRGLIRGLGQVGTLLSALEEVLATLHDVADSVEAAEVDADREAALHAEVDVLMDTIEVSLAILLDSVAAARGVG